MDYNLGIKKYLFFYFTVILFLSGCTDKNNRSNGNIYYIEVVNCSDSLKNNLFSNITGKTSFIKNKQLQIFSLNYLTEDQPGMHFYKNIKDVEKELKEGSQKIKIEFSGNFTNDSTYYSLQKFTYNNNQWKKISDIGFIRAITQNRRSKKNDWFDYNELSQQIVNNTAASTH